MPAKALVDERALAVSDGILDAAGRCFEQHGVASTSIGDIARMAGCSRPTIYRYFVDRDALRTAFVHREARRVGARVLAEVTPDHEADAGAYLVHIIEAALRAVRADATLSAWFTSAAAGEAARIAGSSAVIAAMVDSLAASASQAADGLASQWIVRVILSLLAMPGADQSEERLFLERFVVPVLRPVEQPAGRKAAVTPPR
jgi:AcrR family transcriptional regulator